MIRTWEVTAEINQDASRHETVIVKANTLMKAKAKGIEKLKANGAFFVWNVQVKEVGISD